MAAPRGESGARLDTEPGRAAEAAYQQQKAAAAAIAAMQVAQSEASFGRYEAAAQAIATAQSAASGAAAQVQQAVASHAAQIQPAISISQTAPLNQPQAQVQANNAYNTYQSALANAQALKANPTVNPSLQTAAQRQALAQLNSAFLASQAANKVLTSTYTQAPSAPTPEPTKPTPAPSNLRPSTPSSPVQQRQSIVKSPNRDVINFQSEEYSASAIARLLFEQVGSIELINIARRDIIEGQNPYYSVISNLSSIKKNFNPTTLISRQRVNETVFDNYTIDLNTKIPDQEYLTDNNLDNFYYIDTNGDLVIELVNLSDDERIELEIAESGTINLVDEA
jgi:hypothetical protein